MPTVPENTTRNLILSKLVASSDFVPVDRQPTVEGTKYIAAFKSRTGIVMALDKTSASKQPIWCLDRVPLRTALEKSGLDFEYYPPDRGRNSNLHKLIGFKSGALLRIYPKTVEEANTAIGLICATTT